MSPGSDAPRADERHVVALRRELHVDRVPSTVPARLTAISRYALAVNGVEVCRGPIRDNPRRQWWDEVDLAPLLREGTNVLTVLAWSYGAPTPWFLPAPIFGNDLAGGAFVFEADLGVDATSGDGSAPSPECCVTDNSWMGTVLDGWGASAAEGVRGRGQETLDARSLPADWMHAGDDPGWPAAIERQARTTGEPGRPQPPSYPGGPFGPRPINLATPTDVALAATPSVGAEPAGTMELVGDRISAGTLVVDVEGPAGAGVTVRPAEFLDDDGRPAPSDHDADARFVCDGGRRTLETVDAYGLQGAVIAADEGVAVHSVSVRERLYPVTGDATFGCSDPRLKQIWRVGRRTVSLCSHDAYLDCPTREQRAWTGDSVVHQMVDLTTNGDWRLARWHPHLAAVPRPDGMLPMAVAGDAEHADFTVIPDWALHWVHSVWNLYRYCGDRDEIAGLLPVAESVVRWFERFCDDDGLPTDVFGWVIIDWASVYTEGVCAALCGLWGRALDEFAQMSEWLDDHGRARWARAAHTRLAAGFERLWDAERGRYVDSMVSGRQRPMASQHGQAAAIVGRLAPRERWDRLVEVLLDDDALIHATFGVPDGPAEPNSGAPVGGPYLRAGHPDPWWDTERQLVRAQPFFRYVVHDALADAGHADALPELLLDWTTALGRCDTSWTETWFGGTISHGWSSTPTRDLMVRVLGVRPAEPGFTSAEVEPHLGHLSWAAGRVPCGEGFIDLRVDPDTLQVDSPIPFEHAGQRYAPGTHQISRP